MTANDEQYVPTDGDVRWHYAVKRMDDGATRTHAEQEYTRWLTAHDARVRRDAAREALDGLSTWLGELAEKHPARSTHVPLMQGHIARYTTDHHPEETP